MDYRLGPGNIEARATHSSFISNATLPSHDYDALDPHVLPGAAPAYTLHVAGTMNNLPGKPRQLSEKEWEDLRDVYTYHARQAQDFSIPKTIDQAVFQLEVQEERQKGRDKTFLAKDGLCFKTSSMFCGRRLQYGGSRGSVEPLSAYQYEGESAGDVAVENLDISSSPAVLNLSPNTTSPIVRHDLSDIRSSISTFSPNTISPMALPSSISPRTVGPLASDEPAIGPDDASRQLILGSSLPSSPISGDPEPLLLHRLFSALSFTPPNDITPLCQSVIATEIIIEESDTISNEEFKNLSHGGGDAFSQGTDMTICSIQRPSLRKRITESGFKYLGMDAGSGIFWPRTLRRSRATIQPCPINLSVTSWTNSRYIVSIKRDLAEVILHQGRFAEANQLAQEVHKAALSIDVSGGHLIQNSLQVLAQSYGNLRNLEKEEELLRELVQIRLVTSEPRHGDTLAAIRSLCDSIIDSERHAESEELLRVALELSQNAQGMSDRRKCLIFRKLATVLYKQKNYPESKKLYRKTAEMSERLLGNEHPDNLRCRFWLCRVLRARGSLEESSRILQETVEIQIRTRGELGGSTIEPMAGLSTILAQMERMEEAEIWMMRALRCSQQVGGVESTRTARFCDDLERLPAGQEQRNAVVDLYEEMGREISTFVGPGLALLRDVKMERQESGMNKDGAIQEVMDNIP